MVSLYGRDGRIIWAGSPLCLSRAVLFILILVTPSSPYSAIDILAQSEILENFSTPFDFIAYSFNCALFSQPPPRRWLRNERVCRRARMPIQFSSTSDILRKHIGKSAISPTLVGVLWLHWQWISRHHLGIYSRVFRSFVRGSKYCWRRRPGDCNKIEENVPQFALSSARRSRDLKDQASRRIRDTRAHVSSTQQQHKSTKWYNVSCSFIHLCKNIPFTLLERSFTAVGGCGQTSVT